MLPDAQAAGAQTAGVRAADVRAADEQTAAAAISDAGPSELQDAGNDAPLTGVRVVSLALNVPGPVAAARLQGAGAHVTTVLPPGGDPLAVYSQGWFDALHVGQDVITLNLKQAEDFAVLARLLERSDVLLTSSRPSALARLGLGPAEVRRRWPRLCHVEIVGHAGDEAEVAGHDLTYQAVSGLIAAMPPATSHPSDPSPSSTVSDPSTSSTASDPATTSTTSSPPMPTTLMSDLAGAERAVAAAALALLQRHRTGLGSRRVVALADVADDFAEPVRRRLTTPDGLLGGGHPSYQMYVTKDGVIALAALEPHFWRATAAALQIDGDPTDPSQLPAIATQLAAAFAQRRNHEWLTWAGERDIPLAIVATPVGSAS